MQAPSGMPTWRSNILRPTPLTRGGSARSGATLAAAAAGGSRGERAPVWIAAARAAVCQQLPARALVGFQAPGSTRVPSRGVAAEQVRPAGGRLVGAAASMRRPATAAAAGSMPPPVPPAAATQAAAAWNIVVWWSYVVMPRARGVNKVDALYLLSSGSVTRQRD